MTDKYLPTDPYKGVRDFYPEDMAVQRYIFDIWAKTAESFGFERYDASVLEPADLYRSKGAENEELVNEQTYTFTDRGDREVTLRPEMTPTVARMVAGRRRDLVFPLRWYSIPNLFRYERTQRGRLREHWQLNCDIFGANDISADVEIIALAYRIMINFGATSEMFEIRVNHRGVFIEFLQSIARNCGFKLSDEQCLEILRLRDRKNKIPESEYVTKLEVIVGTDAYPVFAEQLHLKDNIKDFDSESQDDLWKIGNSLYELGIKNVIPDATLSRGFDYYTGTIFEFFDVSGENNRSLLGGGRYDNLTSLFGGEPISGIGFGMGDVTMRDFLETHGLLEGRVLPTTPQLLILTTGSELNLDAQKLAAGFRGVGISVAIDIGTKKLDKKLQDANKRNVAFVLVYGEDEREKGLYTLKRMSDGLEVTGDVATLVPQIK